jgi:flavin reductase (DIM6/NTAB) family NADH-FMN oxidoreductase RutF
MCSSKINETIKLLVHGVYIIGVKHKSKINGMTAAWVNQVSSKPPMISVAIGKRHYTADLISKAKSFTVNILSPEQMELAKKCGFISGRDQDKLKEEEIMYQSTGAPILSNCAAYLECKLFHQIEAGDHILFIGTVIKADNKDKSILIYKSKDFFNN